jgi:hypothetical protein
MFFHSVYSSLFTFPFILRFGPSSDVYCTVVLLIVIMTC